MAFRTLALSFLIGIATTAHAQSVPVPVQPVPPSPTSHSARPMAPLSAVSKPAPTGKAFASVKSDQAPGLPPGLATGFFNQPFRFEPNKGQHPGKSSFVTDRFSPQSVHLDSAGATLIVPRHNVGKVTAKMNKRRLQPLEMRMSFANANTSPKMTGEAQLPGTSSYSVGNDPKQSHLGVKAFSRVRYQEIYKGVDAVFYGNGKKLEYDLVVAPDAKVEQICLKFDKAKKMKVAKSGALSFVADGETIVQDAPVAYQLGEDGKRQSVAVQFDVKKDGLVGFHVGAYDAKRPLIIDPVIYFLGYFNQSKASNDEVAAVAYQPGTGLTQATNGDIYVAYNFDSNTSPHYRDFGVARYTSQGVLISNHEYISRGSRTIDDCVNEITDMGIDQAGFVYVCGRTNTESIGDDGRYPFTLRDLPTTSNAYKQYRFDVPTQYSRPFAGFVMILNPNMENVYCSYVGGDDGDETEALGIAVEPQGSAAYLTGFTTATDNGGSHDWPTPNALPNIGSNSNGKTDVFVTRLLMPIDGAPRPNNSVTFQTYLGGADDDRGNDIKLLDERLYITGTTKSSGFPVQGFGITDSSLLSSSGSSNSGKGKEDVFFTMITPPQGLNGQGSSIVASGTFGGADDDRGNALVVNGDIHAPSPLGPPMEIFITGTTRSSGFPVVSPLPTNAGLQGGSDAFVTKLHVGKQNGQNVFKIAYSTFLGGIIEDEGVDIAYSGESYPLPLNPTKQSVTVIGNLGNSAGYPRVEKYGAVGNQIFAARLAADSATLLQTDLFGGTVVAKAKSVADDRHGNLLFGGSVVGLIQLLFHSGNIIGTYKSAPPPDQTATVPDGFIAKVDLRETADRGLFFVPALLPFGVGKDSSDGQSREAYPYHGQGHMEVGAETTFVPLGRNKASWRMLVDNNSADNTAVVKLEVYDKSAGTVITSRDIYRKEFAGTNLYQEFTLDFLHQNPGHLIELRTMYNATSYVKLGALGFQQTQWPALDPVIGHNTGAGNQGRVESDNTYSVNDTQDVPSYINVGPFATNTVDVTTGHQMAYWTFRKNDNVVNNDNVIRIEVFDKDADEIIAARNVVRTEWTNNFGDHNFYLRFSWPQSRAGHRIEFRSFWYDPQLTQVKQSAVGLIGQSVPWANLVNVNTLYRMTNNSSDMVSADPAEVATITQPGSGWTLLGPIGSVARTMPPDSGMIAVYRLKHSQGDKLFSMNRDEINAAKSIGYEEEGIAFFLYPTPAAGRRPLYRYRNTSNGAHFCNTDSNEWSNPPAGVVKEGILGYTDN